MMLWRAAALMATTFCMTLSPCAAFGGASLDKSVNEPRFPDVCTGSQKWFHGSENCFVRPPATKHSGQKCEYFQSAGNCREGRKRDEIPPVALAGGVLNRPRVGATSSFARTTVS